MKNQRKRKEKDKNSKKDSKSQKVKGETGSYSSKKGIIKSK